MKTHLQDFYDWSTTPYTPASGGHSLIFRRCAGKIKCKYNFI